MFYLHRDRHLLRDAATGARPAGVDDEDAVHRDPAGLSRGPRHRHAPLHRQRLPRRREGVAEVPERDQAERLQGGRRAASPATSRARRSSRSSSSDGALRGRAVRRPPPRARRRGARRRSSATSPTSATTRSSPRPRRPSGCRPTRPARDELLAAADERARGGVDGSSPPSGWPTATCRSYLIPGNDDEFVIDAILDRPSARRSTPTARSLDLPGDLQLLACGWSNHTPWQTPREESEDELYARLDALAEQVRDPRTRRVHDPRPAARLGPRHRADPRREPAPDDLGGRRAARPGRLDGGAPGDRGVPAAARRSTATSTSRAASASIGETLCINPGSEANHGILRGYLVDIGPDGVERALRVEG